MSTLKLYKGADFIDFFIRKGKEGEYWDFKQEWHERIEDLIKDIICFSNTVLRTVILFLVSLII